MALTMGTLYEALVEGGTSANTVKPAAEAVADCQKRLADSRGDLGVVKVVPGILVAGVAALVIHSFS